MKIEGRRRLCRISNSDANAGKNPMRQEEQKLDDFVDFDSPIQVNNPCESTGNEIRDILNDLSSRLEILSIEKKRVSKKVDSRKDFQGSVGSKLYDVTIKEGFPDYHAASVASHLISSDSVTETIKVRGEVTNEQQKGKTCNTDVKDDTFLGKVKETVYKDHKHMRAHVKSGSTKESQIYNSRREKEDCNNIDYLPSSERHPVKHDVRRGVIEVSDGEESDEVNILDGDVEDFTLSSAKCTYKLAGKIAKMLYPHQREGLKWLWSLHCKGKGGILGDDMGLGKTMQVQEKILLLMIVSKFSIMTLYMIDLSSFFFSQMCSFIAGLFHSNLTRRVLIVAPKTLLTHWINELSTVGLSKLTREYVIIWLLLTKLLWSRALMLIRA